MTKPTKAALLLGYLLVLFMPSGALAQGTIDAVTEVGEKRVAEGVAAQQQVDALGATATSLESQYRQANKVVQGLEIYNELLKKQVDNQLSEMQALSDSINKVSLIERQIVPLMVRMIETLAEFVDLDVPFLPQERAQRVSSLTAMMERSDVTSSEKFRRIIEAYQVENEYGRTIEAYTGSLEVVDGNRAVNYLRIGRVALVYQTDDGELSGAWDQASRSWVALPPALYQREIETGLRIARKQVAPDLLVLPIAAAGAQP